MAEREQILIRDHCAPSSVEGKDAAEEVGVAVEEKITVLVLEMPVEGTVSAQLLQEGPIKLHQGVIGYIKALASHVEGYCIDLWEIVGFVTPNHPLLIYLRLVDQEILMEKTINRH